MNLKLIVTYLALGLCSSSSSAVSLAYFIFPLEQISLKIDSVTQQKQLFKFDIKNHCFRKRCPVEIGIKYVSMKTASTSAQAQSEHIKEFFFQNEGYDPKFPLEVDFELSAANSKVVFRHTKPSGKLHDGYIYGGTTMTSLFGDRSYHCLSPGAYTAQLQILSTERDVTNFSLYLVVTNNFNIKCGD